MSRSPIPPSAPTPKTGRRCNVYWKNPALFLALQAAIDLKLIKGARSASDRLEQLIRMEVKRIAPRMRKAGLKVPKAIIEVE